MCALTSSASGVSARPASSRSTGTSGAHLRTGGVDHTHPVVGEVGQLDHPGPRVAVEALGHVVAVLLVPVPTRYPRRVGHRADERGDPGPEAGRQRGERLFGRTPEVFGVVLH